MKLHRKRVATLSPEAAIARHHLRGLRTACDARGNLPEPRRRELSALVEAIDVRLR